MRSSRVCVVVFAFEARLRGNGVGWTSRQERDEHGNAKSTTNTNTNTINTTTNTTTTKTTRNKNQQRDCQRDCQQQQQQQQQQHHLQQQPARLRGGSPQRTFGSFTPSPSTADPGRALANALGMAENPGLDARTASLPSPLHSPPPPPPPLSKSTPFVTNELLELKVTIHLAHGWINAISRGEEGAVVFWRQLPRYPCSSLASQFFLGGCVASCATCGANALLLSSNEIPPCTYRIVGDTKTTQPLGRLRLLRTEHDSNIHVPNDNVCFRKAADEVFPTTPCSGPTIVWDVERSSVESRSWGGVVLRHLRCFK